MAGGVYRGPAAFAAMATAALLLLGPSSTSAATAAETLRTSLTYTQDKAPREISAVVRPVSSVLCYFLVATDD